MLTVINEHWANYITYIASCQLNYSISSTKEGKYRRAVPWVERVYQHLNVASQSAYDDLQ